MKTITMFLIALLLNKGCDGQTQQDLKNTVIEYSARTRGYSEVIFIKNQEIKIETGIRTESSLEVLSGLKAGDTIITTGILQLRQGLDVEVIKIQNSKF